MATSEQRVLRELKPAFFLRLSARLKPRPTKIDIGKAIGDRAKPPIAGGSFIDNPSAAVDSNVAQDAMNVCDNRIMDSPATTQGSAARWLLLLFLRFYQIFFSPFLGGACKFYPSCSRYAQEAIAAHGARRGAFLAMNRLGRCRPFTKGGFDPVPEPDVANGVGARATTYRTLEYSDADWLRTASKERQ